MCDFFSYRYAVTKCIGGNYFSKLSLRSHKYLNKMKADNGNKLPKMYRIVIVTIKIPYISQFDFGFCAL
jgi:hypothetical protein